MTNITTYLADYKTVNFSILKIDLAFDLYNDFVTVENTMRIKRINCDNKNPICLSGEDLELLEVKLNGVTLSSENYQLDEQSLTIHYDNNEFFLSITTKIYPQNNTELSGLFKSNDLFCTQCEAEGFRRITYFYDRPDVLTSYTTKIIADKEQYPVLLSNGNLVAEGNLAGNRHFVIWEDPFKKPSYLFALVAGKLSHIEDAFVTMSGRNVSLKIYVEPKDIEKCQHAMNSLKKAMLWDEVEYGREYDLNTFMIVAVSDFNMGAMENKGLNIFNSKYILASDSSATDEDYAGIEGVVAHEYFHNWTGNRVTCRDWFQLSLKEGLTVFRDQEFSRDMNSRDMFRIQDVKVLRSTQFPEDASPMAHPVRPTSYQEISNFYTATIYNKGAEVIRMQHTILGKEGFRRGMDLYFARHDGKAVTIDDFVAAMMDANNIDLTQFKNWYDRARTPVVFVNSSFVNNCLTLTFQQTCELSPDFRNSKPFHIPIKIALFTKNGEKISLANDLLEVRENEQSFRFENLSEKPFISLLRNFSAPIILKNNEGEENLLAILKYETDGFAKWDAALSIAKRILLSFYNTDPKSWSIPKNIISVYRHVLMDETQDLDLRAEILTPPSFTDIANEITNLDVELAEDARDFFKKELGNSLYKELQTTYAKLYAAETHKMENEAYGPRKLRNLCLQLMMKADENNSINYCKNQFEKAKTMTCKLASLALLVNASDSKTREDALESFYNEWWGDELVIDKWFSVQTIANSPDILARVKKLLNHRDFHIKNPNRVRALILAFCQNNPRYFHSKDGSGYKFLTEIIVQLDTINPQLSSRMATPFTRWQKYDKTRQELIKSELNLLNGMDLSKDLREIVTKSLQF